MRKQFLAIGMATALAACNAQGMPSGPAAGGITFGATPINPTHYLQTGRIYRSTVPAKQITSATQFQNLCPEDFRKTGALRGIGNHIDTQPVFLGKRSATTSPELGIGLSGLDIAPLASAGVKLGFKSSVSIEVENVNVEELSETGVAVVRSKIGGDCRKLVTKWSGRGHLVFIAQRLFKAGKLVIRVSYTPTIEASAAIKIIEKIAPNLNFTIKNDRSAVAEVNGATIELVPESPL
jgi:hypothetical protein